MNLIKKQYYLKDGKHANILFAEFPEQCSVFAEDDSKKIVGKLSFEIVKVFSRKLSSADKTETSAAQENSEIENDNLTITVTQENQEKYDIKDNILNYQNTKYYLEKTFAMLHLIEILDKNYFQVGLGSVMHDVMEKFAKSEGCSQIRLQKYQPFGQFGHGTKSFYENKNYKLETLDGQKVFCKDLSQKNKSIAKCK